jgi:hypothetical protein
LSRRRFQRSNRSVKLVGTRRSALPAVSPAVPAGGIQRNISLLVACLLLGYYGIELNWSIQEIATCLVGMALLWGPIAALVYVALGGTIVDPMVRLCFSCAASYALTTLLYFAVAVPHLGWLFYAGLSAAGATAIWLGRRPGRSPMRLPRLDGGLLVIVAASLVTTIPYSSVLTLQPSGDRILRGYRDQLYHIGLEYELSRGVPPSQSAIRGGTPERAYHMFPHLTVVLLAKFTRQREMLRAHCVYHYAAITVLICLAMYGIGCLLTANSTGGYVCASLPFLFAIATPPLMPVHPDYFFFTLLPHASSSVFPVLFTSPQMYSGIAVVYGVMLGIAALVRTPRGIALPLVCGLMVAALLRFRIHCWLAAMPLFLLVMLVMWYRTKRLIWLLPAAVAMIVSGLLYAEMLRPEYMRGTAEVHLTINELSQIPFYRLWPFSFKIRDTLLVLLPSPGFEGAWSVACDVGFTIWDMLGIPLSAALLFGWIIMKRSQTTGYYLFTLGIVAASMFLALVLATGYDDYSVPGQLVYHVGWYALPVGGVCLTWLVSRLHQHAKYVSMFLPIIAVILALSSTISQRLVFPELNATLDVITASSWDALQYLKERTPKNAIVISTSPRDRQIVTVPGLGGRSAYLDYGQNPVDDQAFKLNPKDDRSRMLQEMVAAKDPATFCSVITGTPITHVLEEPSGRLMPNLPCLQQLWTGRDGVTSVWQVVHR